MKVFTHKKIESRFRIHCTIYTLNSMIQPSNVSTKDQKVLFINSDSTDLYKEEQLLKMKQSYSNI